jgi:hypothetical protein
VWDEVEEGSNPNPRLDRIFDYYLRMVWQLSLAVPLPYVAGHLFDIGDVGKWGQAFLLSNQKKSAPAEIECAGATLRDKLALEDPVGHIGAFDVQVSGSA